jgi:uncharacterized protein
MEPQAPSSVPPGWYPDPTGTMRWWDGRAWGPAASAYGAPPPPNKTLAIITHLGPFFGGFILPLVIYCVCDKNDRYVRHHASEALNFSLTLLIVQFGGLILFFVAFFGLVAASSSGGGGGAAVGFGAFAIVWLAFFAVAIVGWVFAVIAAIKASQGEWYRYPVCFRFVSGAMPADTPPIHV